MEQKRGEGTQRFKRRGQLGKGVGALKRGGGGEAGTPLQTMTGDGGATNSSRKLIESNLFGDISI